MVSFAGEEVIPVVFSPSPSEKNGSPHIRQLSTSSDSSTSASENGSTLKWHDANINKPIRKDQKKRKMPIVATPYPTKGVFTPTSLGPAPEQHFDQVAGTIARMKSAFKAFKFGAGITTETVNVRERKTDEDTTPRPKIRIRRSTYQGEAERVLDEHEQDKRKVESSDSEEEATSPVIVPATFEKKFGHGREKTKFGHGRAGSRTSNVVPWDDMATIVTNPSQCVRAGYFVGDSDDKA